MLVSLLLGVAASACGYDGPRLTVEELSSRIEADPAGVTVLDVRPRSLFDRGHVAGAINIPLEELDARFSEIASIGGTLAVMCTCGRLSLDAVKRLRARGLDPVLVEGGMRDWERAGYPSGRTVP
jgi:rhodanese-related sulfurtransferase